jgi:hypothetical protein
MTTYNLKQLDGGTVLLPSGRWRWYVIRVNSLPEDVCETQYLFFANETNPGDLMRAAVPPTVQEVSDTEVRELARYPEERSFRDRQGRVQLRPTLDNGREPMWRVRPPTGLAFGTSKHIEKGLGELTPEDLIDIATR